MRSLSIAPANAKLVTGKWQLRVPRAIAKTHNFPLRTRGFSLLAQPEVRCYAIGLATTVDLSNRIEGLGPKSIPAPIAVAAARPSSGQSQEGLVMGSSRRRRATSVVLAVLFAVSIGGSAAGKAKSGGAAGLIFQRGFDIYVSDVDGSNDHLLLAQANYPNFSADATRIVYQNFCGCPYPTDDIYVANADGTGSVRITDWIGADNYPRWSPDGQRIVFIRNVGGNSEDRTLQEIFVMNADGSKATRLTTDPYADYFPFWSPDGSRIVYASLREGQTDLFLIDPDGTQGQSLINSPDWNEQFPAWSPDGKQIAMTRSTLAGDTAITAVLDIRSGRIDMFSDVEGVSSAPKWSPDGKLIAFGHYPQEYVAVMTAAGKMVTDLTPGRSPDWQPK